MMNPEEEWWPSRVMEAQVKEVIGKTFAEALLWEHVEAIAKPTYAYITALLNERGPRSFLVENGGEEITLGIAAWDENDDDILASQQVALSAIVIDSAFGDKHQMRELADALRKSLAIVDAAAQAMETRRAETPQEAPGEA